MFLDLQQRLGDAPSFKTEESLIFRILVQLLVIIGIIATDLAAGTYMSIWAIPLSMIGAGWSWRHRKHKNVAVKFMLVIAMVGILVFFLNKLVVSLGDSRLALAELLVQLQVLHSFDLPRRKDLGYSMMIGLVLLGVAGTISQTLIFAVALLVFLCVALPTLILDYRSRLGIEPIDRRLQDTVSPSFPLKKTKTFYWSLISPLPPRQLGLFFLLTLGLGLLIFVAMPRFPGYQLQTFPVSSPVNSENQQFDAENRKIQNPGYLKEGKAGKDGLNGNSPITGQGEIDKTFYYGFNSQMNQNLRGQMQPQVVLRVRSQAPGFWKVMSFDHYTGQGWEISDKDEIAKLDTYYAYRFYLPGLTTIVNTKRVVQTYTAVSYLPNVIPALYSPKVVFFPAQEIALDNEGSLRAPLGLLEGLTYTIISDVPYRDRTALGQAKGIYPKAIIERYLEISPEIAPTIRQKADELLEKSPKPITNPYEATLFLAQQLKSQYEIRPDLPFLGENEDLVEAFLFKYGGGYPDHFSTVLTMMLRSLGIPARLTTGFTSGQFNPFTGFYIVKNTDAYALTEVYFPNYGWYGFDPIPGHELMPPSFEEHEAFSVIRQLWHWIAGFVPPPILDFVNFLWRRVLEALATVIGWLWSLISGSILGVLFGLLGAIGLSFLGWLGFLRLKARNLSRRLAKLPPIAQIYNQMLQFLQKKGYPKHPAQTPLEYVEISRQQHPPPIAEIIEKISQAYVDWRYGQIEQNNADLRQQLNQLKREFTRR